MTAPSTSSPKRALQALLYPATWALSRLRFLPKFLVIALVLLAPQLVVAWLQYRGASADIEFNRLEDKGMAYLEPLHDYINAQQRHWTLAVARASGLREFAKAEEATAAEVARLEKAVDAVDEQLGVELRTQERWKQAKAAWAAAIGAGAGTPAAIDKAHADATAITSDLIVNHVANHSKLILDPDLDSYWLMDIAVAKAPALGNLIAQQTTTAIVPSSDRTEYVLAIAGPLAAAATALGDLENINLKTAIESTKEFGNNKDLPKLRGPFGEMRAQVQALGDLIRGTYIKAALAPATAPGDAAAAPAAAPQPGAIVAAAVTALERLDKFYDDNNPILAALIETRIAGHTEVRRQGLLLTLLGILLYAYIFAGFYVGISAFVSAVGDATTRMISGTNETFTSPNRDETAEIVGELNQINTALVEARVLRARIEDEHRQTQASIVDLLNVVSDASDGNLTARATTTAGALGNVADAFNLLMESLESLIGEVTQQVQASERAVQSISEVAQQMAVGAASQAAEVVAARSLVAGVAEQISAVHVSAEGASEATRHTAATAQEGEQAVENVVAGMESLRANVQSGAKKMKNLGDRSMEITSIVGTISRISEQTNMLALNAAIEAARAGEHGRGFRVVADEVRKLAERATVATKDIEKLVKAINAETAETIKAIEMQTQVVEDESRTVSVAGDSLRKIRAASDQSAQLVGSITTVASAQVQSAQRVASTMETVSSIASRTQRGAEVTVTTIGELVRLSSSLRVSISKFRTAAGMR